MAALNFPDSPSADQVHTENGKSWVWDGVSWISSIAISEVFIIPASDELTDLEVGDGKATFRTPYALTLVTIKASVTTAPAGSTIIVDITEGGVTILSTLLTIDAGEKTSTTAAVPVVVSDNVLADDAEIQINIDQVGSSTTGTGLKIILEGYKS